MRGHGTVAKPLDLGFSQGNGWGLAPGETTVKSGEEIGRIVILDGPEARHDRVNASGEKRSGK